MITYGEGNIPSFFLFYIDLMRLIYIFIVSLLLVSNVFWECDDYCLEQKQIDKCLEYVEDWNRETKNWYYENAISDYINFLDECTNLDNINDEFVDEISTYVWSLYFTIASDNIDKGKYNLATKNANNAIDYFVKKTDKIEWLILLAQSWLFDWDFEKALQHLNTAKNMAMDKAQLERINWFIQYLQQWLGDYKQENFSTNDYYSFMQHWFQDLNIMEAQKKVKNTHKIIVAVIDDWVHINHPDLSKNIRINTKEIPWNWIDDEWNWYIDDYNGFNFIYNNNNTIPLWSHGTRVAWIIWAIANNEIWVAGIMKNVSIMPVWVCDIEWCNPINVIKWIEYAVNNWADIINLSLWWHQIINSDEYTTAIENANKKGVIVVVAAWNGDVITKSAVWVNTNVNKVAPVCNYGNNKKNIIWVWSISRDWNVTNRSNYWDCVDLYAPWVEITSTTLIGQNNPQYFLLQDWYDTSDWTSFSAPIIAWIIGLWLNKYWKLDRDIVYDSLMQSMVRNKAKVHLVDASLFLDILWEKVNQKNTTIPNNSEVNQTEVNESILWLYNNWLTIFNNTTSFMSDELISREQASKFFSVFNNLINKDWAKSTENCTLKDIKNADHSLLQYINDSCAQWIILWNNGNFMPFWKLTKAQAITILVRIVKWKLNEWWMRRYQEYYNYANEIWLLNNLNYNETTIDGEYITRWEMSILIYRAFNLK